MSRQSKLTKKLLVGPAVILLPVFLLGAAPKTDKEFFNGKDLAGWSAADMSYWSVKDGAIVGHSSQEFPKNEFIWSEVKVTNFYLSIDVKLTPSSRNAGIQFRSSRLKTGQAVGYQADIGGRSFLWGKLYHEHGRKKLDWNNKADGVVKQHEWNHHEILAIGNQIWTIINGKVCTAINDPKGELSGFIALQIHKGPPQTVHYRINKLVHDPEYSITGKSEKELKALLKTL